MSKRKRQHLSSCINHRKIQYEKALDGVIDGKLPPEYATERFNKLKQVRRK